MSNDNLDDILRMELRNIAQRATSKLTTNYLKRYQKNNYGNN
jgi:hypothetical protein